MKKRLTIMILFVLLAVTAFPVLAKQNRPTAASCGQVLRGQPLYAFAGYIRSINDTAKTMTVYVVTGNRLAKPCLYQNVTIHATIGSTRLLLAGGVPIPFERFDPGDPVSSNGYINSTGWMASRITLGATLASK